MRLGLVKMTVLEPVVPLTGKMILLVRLGRLRSRQVLLQQPTEKSVKNQTLR
jgi:hypothetical protein